MHPNSLAPCAQQPGTAQVCEVPRDFCLSLAKSRDQVANAWLSAGLEEASPSPTPLTASPTNGGSTTSPPVGVAALAFLVFAWAMSS